MAAEFGLAELTISTPRIAAIAVAAYVLMGSATFVLFGVDKARARSGQRRIRERTLHLCELAFGVLGAGAGMLAFRHKLRKPSYMAVFVGIVVAHVALWTAIVRSGLA